MDTHFTTCDPSGQRDTRYLDATWFPFPTFAQRVRWNTLRMKFVLINPMGLLGPDRNQWAAKAMAIPHMFLQPRTTMRSVPRRRQR